MAARIVMPKYLELSDPTHLNVRNGRSLQTSPLRLLMQGQQTPAVPTITCQQLRVPSVFPPAPSKRIASIQSVWLVCCRPLWGFASRESVDLLNGCLLHLDQIGRQRRVVQLFDHTLARGINI
jgi:hypothetical protein